MKNIETLKKNYEFQNVLNKGKFFIGKQITVYIKNNKFQKNVIGIAVSRKACKATKRNKIKRKIRENYRLIQHCLKTGNNIVFLWNNKLNIDELDFNIIKTDMFNIFKKAGLLE